MEQLQNLPPSRKTKITGKITELLGTLCLGMGFFQFIITTFSLDYEIKKSFSGSILKGLVASWNHAAEYVGTKLYIILPQYKGAGEEYGLFLTLLLIALIGISYLVIKSRNTYLSLIYLIPIVLTSFGWGIGPAPGAIFLIGTGILLYITIIKMKKEFSLWNLLPIGVIIALTFGITMNGTLRGQLESPKSFEELNRKTTSLVDRVAFGERTIRDNDVAFEITMEEPRQMWLRGFVGENHSFGGWEANSNKEQYEYLPVGRALKKGGLNPLGQLGQINSLINQKKESAKKVTIKFDSAYSKYPLIPYEIHNKNVDFGKNYGDSFLMSDGLFGTKEYSFLATEDATDKWTDLAGKFYQDVSDEPMDENVLNDYKQYEEYLNIYVYKKFTRLEEDDILALYSQFGSPGDQEGGHIEYRTVLDKIIDFTSNKFVYTHRKDSVGADNKHGSGNIEELLQRKTGNDKDFATLATLAFRYYGIPARYVEGYQITSKDARTMKAGEAYEIKGANAHAWPEIYVDCIGWVPIEVNPEFISKMRQADLSKGLENSEFANAFKPHEQKPANQQEDISEKNKKDNKEKIPYKLIIILGFILLVAGLIFWSLWKYIIKGLRRNRAFKQTDPKKAICEIYQDMLKRDWQIPKDAVFIGERAAFSPFPSTEEDRTFMLSMWVKLRKNK